MLNHTPEEEDMIAEPFGKPQAGPAQEMVTEIIFKNGTLMAVYGSRSDIMAQIEKAGQWNEEAQDFTSEWIDLTVHSILSPKSDRATYSALVSEIYLVGVERPATAPTVLVDKGYEGGSFDLRTVLGEGSIN